MEEGPSTELYDINTVKIDALAIINDLIKVGHMTSYFGLIRENDTLNITLLKKDYIINTTSEIFTKYFKNNTTLYLSTVFNSSHCLSQFQTTFVSLFSTGFHPASLEIIQYIYNITGNFDYFYKVDSPDNKININDKLYSVEHNPLFISAMNIQNNPRAKSIFDYLVTVMDIDKYWMSYKMNRVSVLYELLSEILHGNCIVDTLFYVIKSSSNKNLLSMFYALYYRKKMSVAMSKDTNKINVWSNMNKLFIYIITHLIDNLQQNQIFSNIIDIHTISLYLGNYHIHTQLKNSFKILMKCDLIFMNLLCDDLFDLNFMDLLLRNTPKTHIRLASYVDIDHLYSIIKTVTSNIKRYLQINPIQFKKLVEIDWGNLIAPMWRISGLISPDSNKSYVNNILSFIDILDAGIKLDITTHIINLFRCKSFVNSIKENQLIQFLPLWKYVNINVIDNESKLFINIIKSLILTDKSLNKILTTYESNGIQINFTSGFTLIALKNKYYNIADLSIIKEFINLSTNVNRDYVSKYISSIIDEIMLAEKTPWLLLIKALDLVIKNNIIFNINIIQNIKAVNADDLADNSNIINLLSENCIRDDTTDPYLIHKIIRKCVKLNHFYDPFYGIKILKILFNIGKKFEFNLYDTTYGNLNIIACICENGEGDDYYKLLHTFGFNLENVELYGCYRERLDRFLISDVYNKKIGDLGIDIVTKTYTHAKIIIELLNITQKREDDLKNEILQLKLSPYPGSEFIQMWEEEFGKITSDNMEVFISQLSDIYRENIRKNENK